MGGEEGGGREAPSLGWWWRPDLGPLSWGCPVLGMDGPPLWGREAPTPPAVAERGRGGRGAPRAPGQVPAPGGQARGARAGRPGGPAPGARVGERSGREEGWGWGWGGAVCVCVFFSHPLRLR